ncbi:molybdopterin-dependent oxidoreductase [Ectopseudomonas mendocina]|uniref:Molybdopterin-dependent oxidoreductase n=1 Tax=Ectopseudomonas mendocina TaxID=300 RepID=A0ABZ2RHS2_ECTME
MCGPVSHAEVLLSVRSADQTLDITREQIESLPQQQLRTSTAWTDGVREFKGPLLRDVLSLLDKPVAETATARLIALNEYEVKVAIRDFLTWDVIVAYEQDGKALTRSTKGPLWVVYPRDQHEELQDSRVDHRWAWMLRTIVIEP